MHKEGQIVTHLLYRWRQDLRELISSGSRRWERDFQGPLTTADVHYAIFVGALCLLPAAIVLFASSEEHLQALAKFFAVPVHAIISGFLTSTLIFLGSHLNRTPKPFPVAFKLMLRVMSAYPILVFLTWSRWGGILTLLIHGALVVRGVRRTYDIPLRNAMLFFGIIYLVFALLQFQALLMPPSSDPFRNF